jgi:hypothetical protein
MLMVAEWTAEKLVVTRMKKAREYIQVRWRNIFQKEENRIVSRVIQSTQYSS